MKKLLSFLVILVSQIIICTFGQKTVQKADDNLFPLNIIHLNDFHARFEETNLQTSACKQGEKCIGGYARVVSKVKHKNVNHSSSLFRFFLITSLKYLKFYNHGCIKYLTIVFFSLSIDNVIFLIHFFK